jgi:hypothetical protein
MGARDWAEPIRGNGRRDSATAREVASTVKGVITDVKPGAVTVKLRPPGSYPASGGPGDADPPADLPADAPERTFKVDDKTSVAIGTSTEVPSPNGRPGRRDSYRFESVASLKPGMNATIEPGDEDDYAADVRTLQGSKAGGPGL